MITIGVVYAQANVQEVLELQVPEGTTAAEALRICGLEQRHSGPDWSALKIGIYSRLLDGRVNPGPEEYVLQHHDRLELYRPLVIDPKQARLNRAKKNRQAGKQNDRKK
jgi:putative ubiquitin-RnfH superfamily antitoxin RatB of RatAB toxin-antitoxin module